MLGSSPRRVVAALCLVAILLAAFAPTGDGLLWAVVAIVATALGATPSVLLAPARSVVVASLRSARGAGTRAPPIR